MTIDIYQKIRARYELAIRDAVAPVPVMFDNVQEEIPLPGGSDQTYVVLTISFATSILPALSGPPSEDVACGPIGGINGNVQAQVYSTRSLGMLTLETVARQIVCALADIHLYPDPDDVITHVQSVNGPTPALAGNSPFAATVVSAPFTARLSS